MLVGFFGATFLLTLTIRQRKENVDGFMVSSGSIGFGFSASSMTATWVWAASFYAAAEAGYIYGISGPIHYGLWGALMILCIYPFGKRFRTLAPHAHTLAEMVHARHGSSSQLMLAVSNIAGSLISLTANFTAAGALVYVLTPFSFGTGVLAVAVGVLAYTIWSGFRASVLTDYIQLVAMMGAAVIIIPTIFYAAGGPDMISTGMDTLYEQNPQKADFWSKDAFLYQGAPYMVAVLAYAIGNQTIMQRLFAVRVDRIKSTFVTATLGYAGTVIGLGMLGVLAAMIGLQPADGNTNNIIPQMGVEFLPVFLIVALFIMVIGSLSSTADSDLSALAAIAMTDIYGKNIARGRVKTKTMLLVGRMTMVGATACGVVLAFANFNILDLLVFVGGLWGALVFPVIMSFYWNRITSKAFTISVVVAVVFFLLTRFELIPMFGVQAVVFELFSALGAASAVGLMVFGIFGRRPGLIAAAIMFVAMVPLFLGFLRDYPALLSALVAYGISTALCVGISFRSNESFDFDLIDERVMSFQGGETRTTTITNADGSDTADHGSPQLAHRLADGDDGGTDTDPKGGVRV
ncbi:Sodium/pantothenate symporter [Corynebacterium occultum]|uniref:Sodium/pantothenate symporter n=1 Tax=Corynebacterium occultum TaxID=2675219 RepID=A0A6B8VZI7_9CORY|nr:sodium:proline symporter [Corynebacterium occultum]QGU08409.1 Sodium/pantothenate symporter [Corynebacterium occultum]